MSYQPWGGIKKWAADDWFSKCIRLAQDHVCERCKREATDCAHIYTRRIVALRWDKDNALALCRGCHRHFEEQPLEMTPFLESIDPGRAERLMIKKRGKLKNNPDIRKMISDHYRAEYRRMESTGERNLKGW
jgi:hypothetical protein